MDKLLITKRVAVAYETFYGPPDQIELDGRILTSERSRSCFGPY